MGNYPLKEKVGMGVVCVTLMLSLRKGVCVGNLQRYSTIKPPMEWSNLYVAEVLGMGDIIFQGTGKILWRQRVIIRGRVLESS